MSRWLVSQGDRQFAAKDLDELKKMALEGRLASTDMIQPPGASDWLYASEIPDLKGLFKKASSSNDDLHDEAPPSSGLSTPLLVVFLLIAIGGGYAAYHYATNLPDAADLELIGEGGMAYTDLLVTQADAPLLDKPDGGTVGALEKDTKATMLGKRGAWYHVRNEDGQQGYVRNEHVIPGYLFGGKKVHEDYDPLYNPDRYLSVQNASWLRPDPRDPVTSHFEFMLSNQCKFEMTDVMLLATIKDKSGSVLDKVELRIEGVVPRHDSTSVGTLLPDPKDKAGKPRLMTTTMYYELSKTDDTLADRWMDSVEVALKSPQASDADIDLLEVRAIPNPGKELPK